MDNVNKNNIQQGLVGKIYKLLPIYEGKLLDKTELLDRITSYNNFQKNINMVILYLVGIKNRYGDNKYIENIITTLSGLKTIGKDNHSVVRTTIFACVKMAEKMADEYGLRGLDF